MYACVAFDLKPQNQSVEAWNKKENYKNKIVYSTAYSIALE